MFAVEFERGASFEPKVAYTIDMQLRLISVFSLAMASMAAHASFDLMIVPDSAGNGYVRYDPINRVALGTVNVMGGNRVTAISSNPNGLYNYVSGWMQVNNSTGERISNPTFTSGTLLFNLDGTKVAQYTSSSVNIATLSSSSGSISLGPSWAVPGGLSVQGMTAVSSNRWVVYGTTVGGMSAYLINDSGVTLGSLSNFVNSPNMLTTGIGMGTRVVNGTSEYFVMGYRANGGSHNLVALQVLASALSYAAAQTLSNFSTVNVNTSLGLVSGHTGFFVVGADSATPTSARIMEMDVAPVFATVSNHTTNAFAPPTTGSWRMANLVAPEPGPMIALGVGLAALIGRRRRKN